MSNFYDFTLAPHTRDELDAIAMNHLGVVRSISLGYACRGEVPDQHDWGFRWVNTRGEGNRGNLVLVPRSPRSRAVAREGFLRYVMGFTDASRKEAEAYVVASKGVRYAKEKGVMMAVMATKDSPAWEHFVSTPTRRWVEEWGLDELRDLSVPRIISVGEIVKNL